MAGPAFKAGDYEAEIVRQGFGVSKDKATPFFFIEFEPIGLYDPNMPERLQPCPSYTRDIKLWMTDKAAPHSIKRLRELGWEGTDFNEIDFNGSHTFVGQKIMVECKHRHDEDKTYEDWAFPKPSRETEADTTVARKLNAMFGNEARATAPKKKPVQPSRPAPQDGGDDESPF